MRHLKSGRKLNRTASHRKAMLSNLAMSILDKERVTTTVGKAKEVRSHLERLITYGKKGTLHAVRTAARFINDKTILKKLFDDIAPAYKGREGGYSRIVKLKTRRGDNAEMAIIELVGRKGDEQRTRKKKKRAATGKARKASAKKGVKKAAEEGVVEVAAAEEKPAESAAGETQEQAAAPVSEETPEESAK